MEQDRESDKKDLKKNRTDFCVWGRQREQQGRHIVRGGQPARQHTVDLVKVARLLGAVLANVVARKAKVVALGQL